MQLDSGIDSGPILAQQETPIGEEELCNELTEKLFYLGADLIVETISKLAKGIIVPRQQDHENATYTKKLVRQDGLVDWKDGADVILRKIRAHHPWPGSYTYFNGKNLKIIEARISENYNLGPGCVSVQDNAVYIGTSDDSLIVSQLQSEGAKLLRQLISQEATGILKIPFWVKYLQASTFYSIRVSVPGKSGIL